MDSFKVLMAKLVLSFATDFADALRWARQTVYGRLSPVETAVRASHLSDDDLLWIINNHVLMECRVIAVRQIAHPLLLESLGISHGNEYVREAAASVIRDQQTLVRMACSDLMPRVRVAAATRITSIVHLREIARSRFEDVRDIAESQELKQRIQMEIQLYHIKTDN